MICDGINLIALLRTKPKRVIEVLVKMEMNEGQKSFGMPLPRCAALRAALKMIIRIIAAVTRMLLSEKMYFKT